MAHGVDGQERPQNEASGLPACVHWWLLPPPEGRTIEGICKHCGARKTFSSSCIKREWQVRGAAKAPQITLKGPRF